MTTKKKAKKANLVPFFKASLTKTFGSGWAKKEYVTTRMRETYGLGKKDTRYFDLKVIDTDAEGVWFEAWSGEAINTRRNRYHGTTYVNLNDVESSVEAQMIAAEQLPASKDKHDYIR